MGALQGGPVKLSTSLLGFVALLSILVVPFSLVEQHKSSVLLLNRHSGSNGATDKAHDVAPSSGGSAVQDEGNVRVPEGHVGTQLDIDDINIVREQNVALDNPGEGPAFPLEWTAEALQTFDYVDRHLNEVATSDALDKSFEKLDHGFLLRISDGKLYLNGDKELNLDVKGAASWKKQIEGSKAPPRLLCPVLEMLCNRNFTKNIDFIFNFADEPVGVYDDTPFPVFSWVKTNLNSDLLVPYTFSYEGAPLHRPENCEFGKQIESEWSSKRNLAIWRGATTGVRLFTEENWRDQWRPKLVSYCNANPDVCDAKISGFVQATPSAIHQMQKELGNGQHLGMSEQVGYKYLLMVDGNSSPSSRMVTYLRSTSLMIKQESPYIEFFYPSLRPYYHYVPLSRSIEDVGSAVDWARSHDEEVKRMIGAARTFECTHLNKDTVESYVEYIFNLYTSRFEGIRSSISPEKLTLISMDDGGAGLCTGFRVDSCPLLRGNGGSN